MGSSEPARREFFATRTVPTITDEWIEKPTNMTNTNTQEELQGRIAELEAEISILRQQKKYGLVWEDKPEEVVAQCETHVPVLSEVKSKKISDQVKPEENILIEGDNYHALSVLNYTHRKSLDLIYIDPPYNTGASDWKYNNDYVDSDDAFRHSKWLSLMNRRLLLARSLLKDSGSLIVAIDDYELATLGLLLKQVLPHYVQDLIIIEHHPQGAGSNTVSRTHEYAYLMTPPGQGIPNRPRREERQTWSLRRSGQGENNWRAYRPNQFFAILVDEKTKQVIGVDKKLSKNDKYELSDTKEGYKRIYPIDGSGGERAWRYSFESMQRLIDQGKVAYTDRGALAVIKDVVSAVPVSSIWTGSKYNAGSHGSQLLTKIFGKSAAFPYPKSFYNTYDLVNLFVGNNQNAKVLDFFAGSGTTGHAVLELNKQDGGNRQFILCTNNENKIAEEVTYPRVKKVIKGYGDVEGLDGSLRYYKTKLVDVEKLQKVPDEKRLSLTYQAGEMIALRENTFDETEKNDWWQIFSSQTKTVAIYFQEDKQKLRELVSKLSDKAQVVLYVFSWSKNEYTNEFAEYTNIRVEDIPEPIIEVYKEINRLK